MEVVQERKFLNKLMSEKTWNHFRENWLLMISVNNSKIKDVFKFNYLSVQNIIIL